MGAAASVKDVYVDALQWFKEYFDGNIYMEDFRSIDKDHDGGITFIELRKWLHSKASEGRAWKLIMNNEQVMVMAHKHASKYSKTTLLTSAVGQKIVDVADFRNFLIQLFAISLMWVHFKNADSWLEANDAGNDTLNLAEFQLACRSFCSAHQRAEPSEEQMEADFKLLDRNESNSVSFVEICNYCCKFVDPSREDALSMINKSMPSSKLSALLNESFYQLKDEPLPLVTHPHIEFDERNNEAMDALVQTMSKNQQIAEFVEIKMNTQAELGIRGSGTGSSVLGDITEAVQVVDSSNREAIDELLPGKTSPSLSPRGDTQRIN